jgi:hypothetical protein
VIAMHVFSFKTTLFIVCLFVNDFSDENGYSFSITGDREETFCCSTPAKYQFLVNQTLHTTLKEHKVEVLAVIDKKVKWGGIFKLFLPPGLPSFRRPSIQT